MERSREEMYQIALRSILYASIHGRLGGRENVRTYDSIVEALLEDLWDSVYITSIDADGYEEDKSILDQDDLIVRAELSAVDAPPVSEIRDICTIYKELMGHELRICLYVYMELDMEREEK